MIPGFNAVKHYYFRQGVHEMSVAQNPIVDEVVGEAHAQANYSVYKISKKDPEWRKAIELVTSQYSKAFSAQVNVNPDEFIVCKRSEGSGESELVACVGVRYGSEKPLFSEQYLADSIENIITEIEGRSTNRSKIIEVGSLASVANKAGTELIRSLPLMCWCMGVEFVLCTATTQLRYILNKLGLVYYVIASADRKQLADEDKTDWGDYYCSVPKTCYVSISETAKFYAELTGRIQFRSHEFSFESGK